MLKKEQERLGAPVNGTERRILMHLFTALDRHGWLVVHGEEPAAAVGKIVVPWDAIRDVWPETMPEEDDRKKATARIGKEFSPARITCSRTASSASTARTSGGPAGQCAVSPAPPQESDRLRGEATA